MIDTDYIHSIALKDKDATLRKIGKMDLRKWGEEGVLLALNIFPSLAEDDGVRNKVKQFLLSEAHLHRRYASLILCDIGDPLGILHLTYNSLGRHPITKQRQNNGYHALAEMAKISLFRRLSHVTGECANLLLEDCLYKYGNRNFEILSGIKIDSVINTAQDWLEESDALSFGGAFILAMNGISSGADILKTCAKNWKTYLNQFNDSKYITFSGKNPKFVFSKKHDFKFYDPLALVEASIIALSHVPDSESLEIMEFFANSDSDFCKNIGCNNRITAQSAIRHDYLTNKKSHGLLSTILDHYISEHKFLLNNETVYVRVISHGDNWYCIDGKISLIDFLIEFSTKNDRDILLGVQRKLMAKIPDGVYFKRIVCANCFMGLPMMSDRLNSYLADITQSDVGLAATEWINFPEKYRCGYLREGFGARNL